MGLQSLDQLPVLDDPTGNANVLEAMAAAAQGAIGGEPDLLAVLPHEVGGQEPVESVTDTGGKRPVDDFFQNVETDLRDDHVDTPGGIQGNT
jgi:segregation and condensation protein B